MPDVRDVFTLYSQLSMQEHKKALYNDFILTTYR